MSHLKTLNGPAPKKAYTPPAGDAQRKAMIAIAWQMKWGNNNAEVVAKLNQWCLDQKFKQPLNDHTEAELNTLLHVLRTKVLGSYLKDFNR